ncbi:MAG: peptidoglycan-binding protein [Candidatus Omnitrophota bacterium]
MSKKLLVVFVVALAIVPLAIVGCKAKTESIPEEMTEAPVSSTPAVEEAQVVQVTEPAQTVATEAIPPTAAPQPVIEKPAALLQTVGDRSKDIQSALKNAGFYSGAIDGKIGPKTKKAIQEFQAAKGLTVDGKVGPKTWAELAKYLSQ